LMYISYGGQRQRMRSKDQAKIVKEMASRK